MLAHPEDGCTTHGCTIALPVLPLYSQYCHCIAVVLPLCLQLKTAYPDLFKDRSLAPPPKHTLAALGGHAQQKEMLDRCGSPAAGNSILHSSQMIDLTQHHTVCSSM
jgi:hypothetical protein